MISLNKMLGDFKGKFDDKILETKLNKSLEMLRSGNSEELAKKINKLDKNELLSKINEFDASKLKELNISTKEISDKVSESDFDKLSQLIGENGDEIIKKIKDILNK